MAKGVLHLPGGLGVHPDPLAGTDVKPAALGELVGAHQRVEVGLHAVLEEFARLLELGVVPAQTHEQVASAHQRGAQRGLGNAAAPRSLDQHARKTRVHRQPQHLAADGGQRSVGQRAEDGQQRLRALHGFGVRPVQPVEFGRTFDPERVEQQDCFREVGALDFRSVLRGAGEMVAVGPEPPAGSRRGAARAAGPLVRTGAADLLDGQRLDAAFGIITGDARQAGVHDMTDAVNGHAGLGDVGGDDDLARVAGLKGAVLVVRRQVAMQREEQAPFGEPRATQGVDGRVDLAHAWHEHEDISRIAIADDALDGLGRPLRRGPLITVFRPVDRDGERASFGNEDRGRAFWILREITRDRLRFERRGHHHNFQVWTRRLLEALHQCECDVAEQVSLVKLVEHHDAYVAQFMVVLQPAQEDALRDEAEARGFRQMLLEPHLVTHFTAEPAAAFPRHPRRHGARGDPAGLQDHDAFRPATPASRSICGTCVVLPEPVAATRTS